MKTTHLYEWLVRWQGGKLNGWHVKLVTTHTDDETGQVEGEKISDAMTPAQAEALGFSLVDVLETLHVDALTLAEDRRAELERKSVEMEIAANEKDAALAAEQNARQVKEEEAAQLAAALTAKETELEVIKLPEKERQKRAIDAQISALNKAKADIDAPLKGNK